MADTRYEWNTAVIHLFIALVASGAGVWVWMISHFYSATGLFVGAITNLLIGIEKLKLLERKSD